MPRNEVFGSMQLTIETEVHGKLNESEIIMFMKNFRGLCGCCFTHTLYFLVGRDTPTVTPYPGVELRFRFIVGGEIMPQLAL